MRVLSSTQESKMAAKIMMKVHEPPKAATLNGFTKSGR